MVFTVHIDVRMPQLAPLGPALARLLELGEQLVAKLDAIHESLDMVDSTLDTELSQIADAIAADDVTPEEVQGVVDRLSALRQRIADIIPDVPPEPEPIP